MSTSKYIIDLEKLIDLFGLFVLGTISTILYYVLPSTTRFAWWPSFYQSLPILAFLTFEVVVLSLLFHYSTKGKQKIVDYVNSHKRESFFVLFGIVVVTYLVLAYFSTANRLMNVLFQFVGLVIAIVVYPIANKLVLKLWDKISKD